MSDETKDDVKEEVNDETGLNASQANESQSDDSATTETDSGDFNPAEWEAQFGLEEGSLKDCKSVEEVLQAVAEAADKTILAGLTAPTNEANPSDFPKTEPEKPATPAQSGTQTQSSGNAEIDALKQQLGLIQQEIRQSREVAEKAILAESERRLNKEIDSWASAKYGVGKNRNSKQYRAYQALVNEMRTYVAGRAALGQSIPDVEIIARQVRAFHDDTFKPTALKLNKQAPLGTPGTSKEHKGDKGPKNIYEVIQQL